MTLASWLSLVYSDCIIFLVFAINASISSLVQPAVGISGNICIMAWPGRKVFSSLFKNQYFDMTTGCMGHWLWRAIWKEPFLKGNKVSRELRVPSGNSNNLQPLSLMALDSFRKALIESVLRDLFMNRVPHSQEPKPKKGKYKISFFETTVARPIIGHR